MGDHPGEDPADQLRRVAAYEQRLRHTPLTALLRVLAPTRPFAAFYRRVGPRLDRFLIRASSGRVASRLYGLPVLLLSTTGAKSGQTRTTPLLYVRDGLDFAVAGTNFGHPAHPGWTANLLAGPGGHDRDRARAHPCYRGTRRRRCTEPGMATVPVCLSRLWALRQPARRPAAHVPPAPTRRGRPGRRPSGLSPIPRLARGDAPSRDGG